MTQNLLHQLKDTMQRLLVKMDNFAIAVKQMELDSVALLIRTGHLLIHPMMVNSTGTCTVRAQLSAITQIT